MAIYRATPLPMGVHPCGAHPCTSTAKTRHGAADANAPKTFCGQTISPGVAAAEVDAMPVTSNCKICEKSALQR